MKVISINTNLKKSSDLKKEHFEKLKERARIHKIQVSLDKINKMMDELREISK